MKIPRHRLNVDKIKPKKNLTIDTNTENTGEISFFFSAIFHSLATEWNKKKWNRHRHCVDFRALHLSYQGMM
jgi:hypothetical protein